MALSQLVYTSTATKLFQASQLADLLTSARKKNLAAGVTGLLLYNHGTFFQVLEGEEEIVDRIFERIERDPRHENIRMLTRKLDGGRNFEGWSMGFLDMSHSSARLPGHLSLLRTNSSYLNLKGDPELVKSLIDAFHHGELRDCVEV